MTHLGHEFSSLMLVLSLDDSCAPQEDDCPSVMFSNFDENDGIQREPTSYVDASKESIYLHMHLKVVSCTDSLI